MASSGAVLKMQRQELLRHKVSNLVHFMSDSRACAISAAMPLLIPLHGQKKQIASTLKLTRFGVYNSLQHVFNEITSPKHQGGSSYDLNYLGSKSQKSAQKLIKSSRLNAQHTQPTGTPRGSVTDRKTAPQGQQRKKIDL